ncbi:MAG TPA: ThuA domain-containing protein [Candidatus Limnocylindria bacterium]|nr:ThuA domain-containing protein [Candidatus Limnocylindria bacterium]
MSPVCRRWNMLLSLLLAPLGSALGATNEPVVHMLVPGFTVQELPVKLSNLNNLRFAPDGSLTALGYDGRIWRLRDTDGDGLEDKAEPYWDKATLSVPVGMAWSTAGLYVSSHGKVSLLKDTDGDGRADEEEIMTSGWPATDVASGGVDATAVTLDAAGNLYFGLLGADYSNAYRLRKRKDLKPEEITWLKENNRWREPAGGDSANDEFSLYDVRSQRGTIQQFNPRAKRLTTIATGIRVPYTLAFNRLGDLFNTDQEGETWMPNGNPLDELNQIILGRNYGFPPRQEQWLPDLVSEAPVVAFGPQHQSTCGLVFNEPHPARNITPPTNPGPGIKAAPAGTATAPPVPATAPATAATTGGRTNRALPPLPLDLMKPTPPIVRPAAPAQGLFGPKWWEGDAFVAGESRGKIWRVRLVKTPGGYVGKSYLIARLSMLTLDLAISPKGDLYVCCHSGPPDWGTGPQGEGKIFRISYTDPQPPQPVIAWPASPTEVRVAFDRPVDPSITNAFASASQKIEFGEYVRAADRFETLKPPYAVVSQQEATPRGHLNILGAQLDDEGRTLVLNTDPHPLPVSYALTIPGVKASGAGASGTTVDVDYDLSGAMIEVSHPGGSSRSIWLPHPDARVSRKFVEESAIHQAFYSAQGGTQTLTTKAYPTEGTFRFQWQPPEERISGTDSGFQWKITPAPSQGGIPDPGLLLTATTGHAREALPLSYLGLIVNGSTNVTPPPLGWFRVPWAPANVASSGTDSRAPAFVAGDWENGRGLFYGDKLGCAKCHRVRGEGATVGPDLSNLIHRDATSVTRDIRDPNATLHPDYVTYLAEQKNGETVTGFLRSGAGDTVRMVDAAGKETVIPRAELVNLHPTGQSLMPTGLLDLLKDGEVKDLLTFLLHEPPIRARADVERVLNRSAGTASGGSPLKIVLLASKQDHGPGQHDYPAWQTKWQRLLGTLPNANVSTAWEWPTAEQFATADVLVCYFWNHDWSAERLAQLDAFQARGGGLALIHSATIADKDAEQLVSRMGLSAQPDKVKYRHTPFELHILQRDQPLTHGLPEWLPFLDEPYWPMIGDPSLVTVLATADVDGAARPLVWTYEHGPGRVYASIPGHFVWTLDDPFWRLLTLRGIAWAARRDLDTLTAVTTAEANLK